MPISIRTALRRHVERLLAIPGVAGVAVSERDGRPCIAVYVDPAAGPPPGALPAMLEGYPVVSEAAGRFRALGPD
jgi:hypothetical protein